MTIKPFPYYIISFLISMASCLAFVMSAAELYGDEDYVHNYLGCGPNGDTGAIPIMESVIVSFFVGIFHVLAHLCFLFISRSKEKYKDFKIRLGFYKDEKLINWIIRAIFCFFILLLIYDYSASFYKFYIFEFGSLLFMILTAIMYMLTITNLIGTKSVQLTN